jgi:hypothetical protein
MPNHREKVANGWRMAQGSLVRLKAPAVPDPGFFDGVQMQVDSDGVEFSRQRLNRNKPLLIANSRSRSERYIESPRHAMLVAREG